MLLALTLAVLVLLLTRGRTPERMAAVAFMAATVLTPLVISLRSGGVSWGGAGVEVLLAASLIWLSLTFSRWWLLAAAGVQLLSVLTYILDAALTVQIWAAVSVRLTVWLQLMLIAAFGVVECRRAPYARPSEFTP